MPYCAYLLAERLPRVSFALSPSHIPHMRACSYIAAIGPCHASVASINVPLLLLASFSWKTSPSAHRPSLSSRRFAGHLLFIRLPLQTLSKPTYHLITVPQLPPTRPSFSSTMEVTQTRGRLGPVNSRNLPNSFAEWAAGRNMNRPVQISNQTATANAADQIMFSNPADQNLRLRLEVQGNEEQQTDTLTVTIPRAGLSSSNLARQALNSNKQSALLSDPARAQPQQKKHVEFYDTKGIISEVNSPSTSPGDMEDIKHRQHHQHRRSRSACGHKERRIVDALGSRLKEELQIMKARDQSKHHHPTSCRRHHSHRKHHDGGS